MATCDCFSGTPGESQYAATGSFKEFVGLQVYETKPRETPYLGHILFLPDGFGLATHNLRLADMYAKRGFSTTIVDYFEGDALPDVFMKYTPGTDLESYANLTAREKDAIRKVDMPAWLARHDPVRLWTILQSFFPFFYGGIPSQENGKDTRLSVLGHCFGGKYALRLAQLDNYPNMQSALIFHPSFLEPADTVALLQPVYIGLAETDVFTPSLTYDMLNQLPKSGATYKLVLYGDTKHGFASRANSGDSKAMATFEQAFEDGIRWISEKRSP